jgi:integrase
VHPIRGDELRMLTALRKEYPDSGYVFTTERGTPFTTDAINRQVKIIGQRAGLAFPVHFHMLRHSCGYKLANDGIDHQGDPGLARQWFRHGISEGSRRAEIRHGKRSCRYRDRERAAVLR